MSCRTTFLGNRHSRLGVFSQLLLAGTGYDSAVLICWLYRILLLMRYVKTLSLKHIVCVIYNWSGNQILYSSRTKMFMNILVTKSWINQHRSLDHFNNCTKEIVLLDVLHGCVESLVSLQPSHPPVFSAQWHAETCHCVLHSRTFAWRQNRQDENSCVHVICKVVRMGSG